MPLKSGIHSTETTNKSSSAADRQANATNTKWKDKVDNVVAAAACIFDATLSNATHFEIATDCGSKVYVLVLHFASYFKFLII